jgi:hypothetical protein
MRAVFAFCIICGLLWGFLYSPAQAQWEYGGKTIGYIGSGSDDISAANVGNGATIVVWNLLSTGDYDLFAQYVDSAGFARWGEQGILVYGDDDYNQNYPKVISDGYGGAFVAWTDKRHTPNEGGALYGQHIDSLGNLLWNPEGNKLTADSMTNDLEEMFSDGQGGFICTYRHRYGWSVIDIGAQRVHGDGNIQWDSTGIVLTAAPYQQRYPKTCRASNSTFITCWKDDRDLHNWESDIYIQSFDLAGNILWNSDGIPAVHHPDDQGNLWYGHDIVEDNHGGAVVVWIDSRHHGYYRVLYADRFSPGGQSLWRLNGVKLGDEHIDEAVASQIFRVNTNFIFLWLLNDFSISYYNINGIPLWGGVVSLDTLGPAAYDLTIMEPEGVFKYVAHPRGGDFRFVGWKTNMQGNQYWPDGPLITYSELQRELILTDGYGGMIALWSQSGAVKITRIYEDGHTGGDTTTAIYSNEMKKLPNRITLLQNYPNPFNGYTTISYYLYQQTDVLMEVFDILGRKILERDFSNQIEGTHSYNLNMNDQPSGVYFVRMVTVEDLSARIRILLLK